MKHLLLLAFISSFAFTAIAAEKPNIILILADAKNGKPFFAYVPLASPHTPIVPTPEFQGKSGINPYADFILQIDRDMGIILDAIEKHGLTENTIVIFTTDNGCSPAAKFPQLHAAGHHPSHIARGRTTPGPDLANDVPIKLVKTVPARKNNGSAESYR